MLGTYANNADPVKASIKAAADQGLHCFFTGICMQKTEVKILPKITYGFI